MGWLGLRPRLREAKDNYTLLISDADAAYIQASARSIEAMQQPPRLRQHDSSVFHNLAPLPYFRQHILLSAPG